MTARGRAVLRPPLLLAAVLAWPAYAARAQEPATAHRTGAFQAILAHRSAASAPDRWRERFHFRGALESWDYDLASESFSVYVPPTYDPNGEPFGLVVWVSASDRGEIPDELRAVFDQRRLIWIGPNENGNRRHLFPRMGLALDAARNATELYNVDPDRIYVSGLSGGGKVASMLAIGWADVFTGGLPIIGMTTYVHVPLASRPGDKVYRFPEPSPDLLARAKRQPLVVVTGSGDFNREECQLTAAAYQREGFEHLHLLDIEGMGHELPSPDDFGRALDLLLSATPSYPEAVGR